MRPLTDIEKDRIADSLFKGTTYEYHLRQVHFSRRRAGYGVMAHSHDPHILGIRLRAWVDADTTDEVSEVTTKTGPHTVVRPVSGFIEHTEEVLAREEGATKEDIRRLIDDCCEWLDEELARREQ